MSVFRIFWLCLLCLGASLAWAADLPTTLFAESPVPGAGELLTPRALAIDARSGRRYVLDSGLRRVVVFTAQGEPALTISLPSLGIGDDDVLPADPLLPAPSLAVAGDTVYLTRYARATRTLTLSVVEGAKDGRTVTLPDYATNGAVVLDPLGRVVVAALRLNGASAELVVAREDDAGAFSILDTLKNPCEGQAKGLHLTGIALSNGRLAVGIAQMGDAAYSFVRSWLVEGTLRGSVMGAPLQMVQRNTLIDLRGKLLDRYQVAVDLAGRYGYPPKPCVPLFTALAFGPGGAIITGGHTLDPFLRLYNVNGSLRLSLPRQAAGGQSLMTLSQKDDVRLCALNPALGHVEELALDGRVLDGFGKPYPFCLDTVIALAADPDGVYAVARYDDGLRLLRLQRDGTLAWAQRLSPPRGAEKAQPLLATLDGERVFIGWRQPGANGVCSVESVLEDGSRGPALWPEVAPAPKTRVEAPTPSPLVAGENGRLFVLRDGPTGARIQAFSATGAALQQLPATVAGVTAVRRDGTLAWAHGNADDTAMIFTFYTPQGVQSGWKRIGSEESDLILLRADGYWGWQRDTHRLLRLDDTLTVVDSGQFLSPERERVSDAITAIAGDGASRVYLALQGRIVMMDSAGK
jgi:hypothetical protein